MYRRFDPVLRAWADDPAIHAVVIRGAGERAFCAGGDVRAIYEAGRGISGDPRLTSDFFREEYRADPAYPPLSRSPMSRSSTASRWAAAPGCRSTAPTASPPSARCSRCRRPGSACSPMSARPGSSTSAPGRSAVISRLTGARLGAADALYCGFATHFVPRERVPELVAALGHLAWREGEERAQVDDGARRVSRRSRPSRRSPRGARRSTAALPATRSRRSSTRSRAKRRRTAATANGRRRPAPGS